MKVPKVTIGIISCNRLEYLRATLESAHECIKYPNLEWIVVDNASVEPGLRDYLSSCSWIDILELKEERSPSTEHCEAMNFIINNASGDYVFIWPEDVQFVTKGEWLNDFVEILQNNPCIGSLVVNALRDCTLDSMFRFQKFKFLKKFLIDIKVFKHNFRFQKRMYSSNSLPFRSLGWREEGIIGSGIPSLARTSLWRDLGPWVSPGARAGLVDSSGGGETEMLYRWSMKKWSQHRVISYVPVAADIVSDRYGCKAKVRGDLRYGIYKKPKNKYFYEIKDLSMISRVSYSEWPLSFERFISPIGFNLPLDNKGSMLKTAINEDIKTPVSLGASSSD